MDGYIAFTTSYDQQVVNERILKQKGLDVFACSTLPDDFWIIIIKYSYISIFDS